MKSGENAQLLERNALCGGVGVQVMKKPDWTPKVRSIEKKKRERERRKERKGQGPKGARTKRAAVAPCTFEEGMLQSRMWLRACRKEQRS